MKKHLFYSVFIAEVITKARVASATSDEEDDDQHKKGKAKQKKKPPAKWVRRRLFLS
jgi:hypothetical protein